MKNRRIQNLLLLFVLLTGIFAEAQTKHLSLNDAVLGYYKGLYPMGLTASHWAEDQDLILYLDRAANRYAILDTRGEEVAEYTLNDLKKHAPGATYLPYMPVMEGEHLVLSLENTTYVINDKNNSLIYSITRDEKGENDDFCRKNNTLAYTIDNNLYIARSGEPKIAVTSHEDKNIVAGQYIHRNEFGIEKGTFWSPEGNYLAFYEKDESHVTDYPLVDITTYPATLKSIKYPMAGQGSERAKVGIYDMKTRKTLYLNIDTSDEHYLTNLAWSPDERYITLAELNRGQNHMWFNVYDVQTGNKVKTLFEEQNERWVEPETPAFFLPGSTDRFLWMSERSGFMNLYLYDLHKGLIRQVTDFPFVVTAILGADSQGHVYVSATGEDPKESQVYRVSVKSGKYKQITRAGGQHRAKLSPSGHYLLDGHTSAEIPMRQSIIEIGKRKVKESAVLKEVSDPLADYPRANMEFLQLKAQDGTPLEARIIKPANFDPAKKYPVLVYVYGGPHAQLVTEDWSGGASLWMFYLAQEKGYIVFTVDGRGSAHRGFAFESVIHRHQGKVAMEDQMTGVEYLKSLPYVDSEHMAIFGWSYGGFMTISMMLHHPEVFTTGVAGGPVTDWKYYEVMYGERYMDTPQENPEGYKETALAPYIENLKGRLLVIHGSVDPVVVPQHSLTLLKAAVEHNVPIDFFTYPMHEHNVRGKDRVHLMNKVIAYILEHNR